MISMIDYIHTAYRIHNDRIDIHRLPFETQTPFAYNPIDQLTDNRPDHVTGDNSSSTGHTYLRLLLRNAINH
jgi:hypothetical protein